MQHDSGPQSRFHTLDDLARYSRTASDGLQAYRLAQLTQVRTRAARTAGLLHDQAAHSPRGDGLQSVWPAGTSPYTMLATYPLALHEELRQLNDERRGAPDQLRLAVVEGYSEAVEGGRAGHAPILLARLVDSKACRTGLTALPEACVSLIVDDITHQRVIARGLAGDRSRFVEVLVDEPEKEFRGRAWLTVAGATPGDLEKLAAELEAAGLVPAAATSRVRHRVPAAAPAPGEHSAAPAPRTPADRRAEPVGPPPEAQPPRASQDRSRDRTQERDTLAAEGSSGGEDPAPEVSDSRPGPEPGPGPWMRYFVPIAVALIGGTCAVLAAVLPGGSDDKQGEGDSTGPSVSAPVTVPTGPAHRTHSASRGSPSTDSPGAGGRTFSETSANHAGAPVFADARGTTAGKERIPYATAVPVSCWTENASGMASVNAFYVIGGGPWKGLLAPANTFANGDPLGTQGGSHDIDPKVPQCDGPG
jgi:hypothetical protein